MKTIVFHVSVTFPSMSPGSILHMLFVFSLHRELLEQIKEFEEREFAGTKRDTEFVPKMLQPVNETGGTALLHMVSLGSWEGRLVHQQC